MVCLAESKDATMKNHELTLEERDAAERYAKEKWPDEAVTVEDKTNSDGEIVFRRLKITTKPAKKAISKSKKGG
jgi:hypothetical protein